MLTDKSTWYWYTDKVPNIRLWIMSFSTDIPYIYNEYNDSPGNRKLTQLYVILDVKK